MIGGVKMRKIMISLLSLSIVSAITFGLFMKSTTVETKPNSNTLLIIVGPDEDDNDNTGW